MQHPGAESHSAPDKPSWPPVAIPGQVGNDTGGAPAPDNDGTPEVSSLDQPAKEEVPNPEPTVASALLDDLRAQIAKFVILPSQEALDAVTLWVAATHLQPAWQHAPRLAVVGPAKRCGKSRLLDVLTETVHNRLITVNASPAAIFRSITDEDPPTLLVDEADTLFGTAKAAEKNEDLRGLLNAGHQRNRPTLRVSGPEHKPQAFPTFAMAALAGIGDLPDTIMDRSVVIRMRRRAPGERVAAFRTGRDTPALHAVRNRLTAWLAPLHARAMEMEPVMPVEDRAADTWEPLVIVADLAGGEWPALARAACRAMTDYEAGQDEEGGLRTRILIDIRRAFTAVGDPAVLRTSSLLEYLNGDKEAPWAEYGANGLTPRGLQVLLKDYGIGSANRRFPDGVQAKGFARNQFLDAWARYCPGPKPPAEPAQPMADPGTAA
ncbi:hypothetical protein AV521_40590 [Streptomyces sp. IMTB 2501]|uniref:DUF3631 domain-containing protein n=1 Tax=Streptomyces sp. IMTB 2501 TaxID=1776340 RepID=UPI00096BFB90|nr:DUF3631 domain-containing protein [Streptomyces sp. IMTB 2501]OLZ62904.1 hypothetical protein AV521_40590 [Streptomyces sp. IMTB 2501]